MRLENYDVVVIGGGPAGLAAGLEAKKHGVRVLIIERENHPGGILKQCIHDGFGLIRFKEKLSGPEYAEKYINMVLENGVSILTSTFVTDVKKIDEIFELTLVNSSSGVFNVSSRALVLANGCRERTSKQVGIHGTRPSGVYTAGLAQYLVNISGYLPCKRCVVLGSGDIGLIMARRLTLEGAEVLGVYEAKKTPSGLSRNIAQCLDDYNIPLHLSRTITRIVGEDRVEGVEISEVDENMKPYFGTEEYVECDGVILSVGLIPENEIAESLGIQIDRLTKGPIVDQNFMTMMNGVFSCGNALHVNDLVDYVSESGELAGKSAALYANSKVSRESISIVYSNKDFLYVVPQKIDIKSENKKAILYIRSSEIKNKAVIQVRAGESVLFNKKYGTLRPPEMERLEIDISKVNVGVGEINIFMEG
jgi:thioredoxin reductase